MIKELDCVALTQDLPRAGLRKDDLGTVVLVHAEGKGYEVEFLTLDGDTVAVVSLYPHQIRTIGRNEIAQARTLAVAPA
jgi:hypothetical protein